MNKAIYIFIILLVFGVALAPSAGAKNAFDLGLAGVGARQMGMGRANLAVADDAQAVFSNPAGLGLQKAVSFTSMSTKLLGRVEHKMLGGVYPSDLGVIGVGYLATATPAGFLTTDKLSLASAPAINYGSNMLVVSFAKNLGEAIKLSDSLGELSIGATYRSIQNRFEGVDGTGSGSSLDLGLLFKPNKIVSTALSFRNIGGSIDWLNGTKEELPLSLNLGGALELSQALLALDLEYGKDSPALLHGGGEYRLFDTLTIRAGVDQSRAAVNEIVTNITGGVGVKVNGFSFDYAYRQDKIINDNSAHYFSISFQPPLKQSKFVKIDNLKTNGPDGVYAAANKSKKKEILSYYE